MYAQTSTDQTFLGGDFAGGVILVIFWIFGAEDAFMTFSVEAAPNLSNTVVFFGGGASTFSTK